MICLIHALRGVCSSVSLVADTPGLRPVGNAGIGRMRLVSEAIGTMTVTFAGIVAGSEIHVYLPDGTEVAGIESCGVNQQLSWPVFAAGAANNTVSVTLIKRGQRWMKFPYQSSVGNVTLPIFQSLDLGYNNPA